MTIRKMWLIVLILLSVLLVGINALILTSLTDKYFTDYLKESYEIHIEQILDYSEIAIKDNEISYKQMAIELESHLNDPITQIKLYSEDGDLLVEVEDNNNVTDNMMSNNMGSWMMKNMMDESSNEVIQYKIFDGDKVIGILNVTLRSVAENSFVAMQFKGSLLSNSVYAIFISITISIVVGFFISKKMSLSLRDTAKIASNIQLGEITSVKSTTIKEINIIRESLEELDTRLRLKQKSRKVLVDQLVHQTRTPLTILKSHLEAIEDGLVEVNEDEIEIFKNQIENITTIITNMRNMIDASSETNVINVEVFEINQLLKKIISGLKAQFAKKNITLELVTLEKIIVYTDKDKLSQSIYNILINAYKYTNKYGNVRVSFINQDDKVIINIQDTGIGIGEEEIEKVFSAYYRSKKTINIEGDGLGLYIAKENIKKINGNLNVSSKLKVGSIFTIEIPVIYKKD